MEIKLHDRTIGSKHPTYFIADIAANHDGDLDRAKLLIRHAKQAGAEAAKFLKFPARMNCLKLAMCPDTWTKMAEATRWSECGLRRVASFLWAASVVR